MGGTLDRSLFLFTHFLLELEPCCIYLFHSALLGLEYVMVTIFIRKCSFLNKGKGLIFLSYLLRVSCFCHMSQICCLEPDILQHVILKTLIVYVRNCGIITCIWCFHYGVYYLLSECVSRFESIDIYGNTEKLDQMGLWNIIFVSIGNILGYLYHINTFRVYIRVIVCYYTWMM